MDAATRLEFCVTRGIHLLVVVTKTSYLEILWYSLSPTPCQARSQYTGPYRVGGLILGVPVRHRLLRNGGGVEEDDDGDDHNSGGGTGVVSSGGGAAGDRTRRTADEGSGRGKAGNPTREAATKRARGLDRNLKQVGAAVMFSLHLMYFVFL